MIVQIVTYRLGMSEEDYLTVANDIAPGFAALPGLLTKLWLENPETGWYGAVYLWEDEESMERFLRSPLYEGTNPDFVDVASEEFGVLENLTRITQPVVEILEPARQPAPRAKRPARRAPAPVAKQAKAAGARKIPVTTGAQAKKAAPAAKKATAPAKKATATAKAKKATKASKRSTRA